MARIGDTVFSRVKITVRLSATPTSSALTIIIPAGTRGTVQYTIDDSPAADLIGVTWEVFPQAIIEAREDLCAPRMPT